MSDLPVRVRVRPPSQQPELVDSPLIVACRQELLQGETKSALRMALGLLINELGRREDPPSQPPRFRADTVRALADVPSDSLSPPFLTSSPQYLNSPSPSPGLLPLARSFLRAAKEDCERNKVKDSNRTSLLAAKCICKLDRGYCEGMCGRGKGSHNG